MKARFPDSPFQSSLSDWPLPLIHHMHTRILNIRNRIVRPSIVLLRRGSNSRHMVPAHAHDTLTPAPPVRPKVKINGEW